jgi:hypothetical protein
MRHSVIYTLQSKVIPEFMNKHNEHVFSFGYQHKKEAIKSNQSIQTLSENRHKNCIPEMIFHMHA